MQKDGLHYHEEGARMVAERLGAVAVRFLGLRRRDKNSGQFGNNMGQYGTHPATVRAQGTPDNRVTPNNPVQVVGHPPGGAHLALMTPLRAEETGRQPVLRTTCPVYTQRYQKEHPPQASPLHAVWLPPGLMQPTGHLQGQMSGIPLPRAGSQEERLSPAPTANPTLPVRSQVPHDWFAGYNQYPPCAPSLELANFVNTVVCQQLDALQQRRVF
ncbi:hypothetical protein HPB47_014064 [Ixodes persulcatus]|uniref:Uncharacterized protein n=1 Tax=Ixodes persulcatus TaxID=34615 RepID=A0AC60QZD9_IXOPE|nr:hypothetical protein HPB47_014064 [Ixodes persulcatus]